MEEMLREEIGNKILVVVFGCLSRSLNITYKNHIEKIFSILDANSINYSTCYINNKVTKIDGVKVSDDFKNKIQPDYFLEFSQYFIDSQILKYHPNYKTLYFRKPPASRTDYVEVFGISPFRNSFIETSCSEFMDSKKDHFTHCLAFCSDHWFEKDFQLNWLKSNSLIVSDQNPGRGYTNGFYFGGINDVSKLINSFYSLRQIATLDYEHLLKANAEQNSIKVKEEHYRFLKIRANKQPAYQKRGGIWPKISHILNDYRFKLSSASKQDDNFLK